MSKYADIEQIKKIIRSEWVKYMPSDLDINLSFVLGKIAEVPTIEVNEDCDNCIWNTCNYNKVPWEVSEDCISREWLEERKKVISYTNEWRETETDEFVSWENIKNAPSVVLSRAEGEWINKQEKYQMAECSNCKKVTMHEMWGDKLVYYDYCPNCGAKMKGEEK